MLSPEEADLVRRDPAIPGLATVLDPGAFLLALGRMAPERELRQAQIQYVKYKPQQFCRVAYSIDVAGAVCELEVRACRPEDLRSRREERLQAAVPGLLGPGSLVLEDSAVMVTVFPNDPGLPQVPALTDPARRIQIMRDLLPDRPDLWMGELRCLRYWPGRRYSAELANPGGARALLKAYTRRGYMRALRNSDAFRSNQRMRVARRLGSSDTHRMIAFEWLPGRMLSELCLEPGSDGAPWSDTGMALCALHAQPAHGLERFSRDEERGYMGSLAREVGFLCPTLAARAEALVRRILSLLERSPAGERPFHGDLSDTQVLIDGRSVAIVDLDSARSGDPADDLGTLLAQIESYVLRGKLPPARARAFRQALLDGYRHAPESSGVERILPYTASGLLRRARFGFRTRRPDWREITERSLARAEAILDGRD